MSLGLLASQSARVEEALGEWRKALDVDPHAYEALFNPGATLLQLGRTAEARPYVERHIREDPPSEAANAARLRLLLSKAAS